MARYIKDANAFRKMNKEKNEKKLRVASYIAPETTPVEKLDKVVFNNGVEWFNSGLSLEEAGDKVKSSNFVNGFNHAKRLQMIKEMFYNDGIEWFKSGRTIEEAPEKLKNQEPFIQGFNHAKNNKIKK